MNRLDLDDLSSLWVPLYGFTRDSVIPKEIIKLAITLGEPPPTTTVVIDFLTVNCLSAFNEVLARLY